MNAEPPEAHFHVEYQPRRPGYANRYPTYCRLMTAPIPHSELQAIPFFDSGFDPAHVITTLSFYVDGEWHSWIPVGDKLQKMKGWPVEANYFGDCRERDTDQRFPLLELLSQRTLTNDMHGRFRAIWNDFQMMAASLGKVQLFYESRDHTTLGIRRFMQSEIEMLTNVCRSIFDLLQEIAAAHIARIHVPDSPPAKRLPSSFRAMVFKSNARMSVTEIVTRYQIPAEIAEWYCRHIDFFLDLRSIRDKFIHGGKTIEMIFSTDRGFAVSREDDPFYGLFDWPVSCESPNSLVPIRPVLCTVVRCTLDACDDFVKTLESSVQLPDMLAPKLSLWSRGINDHKLEEIDSVLAGSLWDEG